MKFAVNQQTLTKLPTRSCTDEIKIAKKCPNCGWRILDKITPTTGVIQMKCPRCKQEVQINLAFRRQR